MPRLVSRQKFLPGGWKYYQPEIKFEARQHMSFQGLVQALIYARAANPHLVQKHGWSLDYDTVANEVDAWNAKVAAEFGWTEYYTDGEPTGGNRQPFHQPPQNRPGPLQVAAGAKPVVEWLMSGAEAVPMEQANKRAEICVTCPLNEKGDWKRWFTVPVAEAIMTALHSRKSMKLATAFDESIFLCGACACPLKLMVHFPIERKMKALKRDTFDQMPDFCWVRKEANEKGLNPAP